MHWVALVALLAALQSFVFGGLVARARGKYQVTAPAVTGNEVFERYFRVHYNSNEQLIIFLPALWIYATYLSAIWAAGLGALYLLGRTIYAIGYVRAPGKRSIGFYISGIPNGILLFGGIAGVVRTLLTQH